MIAIPAPTIAHISSIVDRIGVPLVRIYNTKNKAEAIRDSALNDITTEVRAKIGECGRLMIRESGTEPKIRIMVEAQTDELCQKYANEISSVLKSRGHIDE